MQVTPVMSVLFQVGFRSQMTAITPVIRPEKGKQEEFLRDCRTRLGKTQEVLIILWNNNNMSVFASKNITASATTFDLISGIR